MRGKVQQLECMVLQARRNDHTVVFHAQPPLAMEF
jgi:hypothetical protein